MNAIKRIQYLLSIINNHWLLWVVSVLGLCIAYYLFMLLALIIKFQAIPNYISVFDWIDNVSWILVSTPSLKDAMLIISEEWWIEIGFMNFDFGLGISEWSLFISPWKILGVLGFSALIVTYFIVMRFRSQACSLAVNFTSKITSGLGGIFFGITSLTMSWVVCCATPTWVVGLAIMGLGVSTSLSIEPVGFWLNALGFILMIIALFMVSLKELNYVNNENDVNNPIRKKL